VHERTGFPSTRTVHAPHSPSPQPYFVPVSSSDSRSTQSRRVSGSASTARADPLTLRVSRAIRPEYTPHCRAAMPQCSVPQCYSACVMSTVASFDISKSAVLALDCQRGIVSIYAKPPEAFIDRTSGVLHAARNAGILVIHVQVGFRTGLPEVSDGTSFCRLLNRPRSIESCSRAHPAKSIMPLDPNQGTSS
jgi:hypothetical protein